MSQFKVGDVVCLKSGGPDMTVKEITSDNQISCEWFDDKNSEVKCYFFNSAMLSKND